MTSPPSPPNRRRRRVVVTIAVLVLGLCWWYWPRVDHRFEGRWKISVATEGPDFITFRPDGVATLEFRSGERIDMAWRKQGPELVCELQGREKRSQIRFVSADRVELGVPGKVGYTVLDRTDD